MRPWPCQLLLIGLMVTDVTSITHGARGSYTDNETHEGAIRLTVIEKWEILEVHHSLRRQVNATNMKLMQWDCGLEQFAYNYIRTRSRSCKEQHSSDEMRTDFSKTGWNGKIGETLFSALGFAYGRNMDTVLKDKTYPIYESYYERNHLKWNFTNGSCNNGRCENYEQMVWADSHALGCAFHICYPAHTSKWMHLYCNYGPGGHLVKDGVKVPAYKEGNETCSDCKDTEDIGWTNYCLDGMCSDSLEPHPIPNCYPVYEDWSRPDWLSTASLVASVNPASLVLLSVVTGCMRRMDIHGHD